jgi:pyruvate/2-oxoglutarate/acetoin dehydrogenase E1 component
MLYELAIMHWLTNGERPNGMIIRLQGFDRGLFGGNFHTHNTLQHMPPGLDVVCYSNGEDYVRGFRNALAQARNGRVVMFVDCTALLSLRHLHDKDRAWERAYPAKDDENPLMRFDDIRRYGTTGTLAIVSYGNGVVTALQARRSLWESGVIPDEGDIDVIDCPYISQVPEGLKSIVGGYQGLVFADICKSGPGSGVLASMVASLQSEQLLPSKWEVVAAPRTYNPLGNMCTFLDEDDLCDAIKRMVSQTKPSQYINERSK